MNKGVIAAIIVSLCVVTVLASTGMPTAMSTLFFDQSSPRIIASSANPIKVFPGQTLTIATEVEDSHGIINAIAHFYHEDGFDQVPMMLVASNEKTNRYTYEAKWEVHNTKHEIWYHTTVQLTNTKGKLATTDVKWQDPAVSHTAEEILPGVFPNGTYTFTGTVNATDLSLVNSLSASDCAKITGGAGLCDGSDATAGLSQSIQTSSGSGSSTVCCPGSPGTIAGGGCHITSGSGQITQSEPHSGCASSNGWACTSSVGGDTIEVHAICITVS